MQYVYAVAAFLGGLGAFLVGVKLLSESMEKLASKRLKNLFNKTSKNGFAGVGMGLVSTMVVQSSSLTTVMVVGLVNAGIMSLYQATTIIMGANIGTTVTAQIAALQTFDFISLAMALTCVGAFTAMFAKRDGTKAAANLMCGLGLIFMGMQFMSDSMKFFRDSEVVTNAFASVQNPFLLLLIGIVVTGIIQSSSAVTSIIISMAAAGIVIGSGGNSVLYVVLGTNIGTCVTALMSSIGAGTNARRAALIHLLFNFFGAFLFMILLLCWPSFMEVTFQRWFPSVPATQIAMFHTFFNVVCTALFLPFAKLFVKISIFIVRDKKQKTKKASTQTYLDERLLNTPAVAMNQAVKETVRMCGLSMSGLATAFEAFIAKDSARKNSVREICSEVESVNKSIQDFLVELSVRDVTYADEKTISAFHYVLNDIMRISELADNITKYTDSVVADRLVFSDEVVGALKAMFEKINELYGQTVDCFSQKNRILLGRVDETEEEIDRARKQLIANHIRRLNEGKCQPSSSGVFINLVGNLERAADHLTYIAHSIEM